MTSKDNDGPVSLSSVRFRRDHLEYLSQKRALMNDLRNALAVHAERGCNDDILIRALAETMVGLGITAKTNGVSLMKCLATEIDGAVFGENEQRFADWFVEGVPRGMIEWEQLQIYGAD
jgi:hypothetical protein